MTSPRRHTTHNKTVQTSRWWPCQRHPARTSRNSDNVSGLHRNAIRAKVGRALRHDCCQNCGGADPRQQSAVLYPQSSVLVFSLQSSVLSPQSSLPPLQPWLSIAPGPSLWQAQLDGTARTSMWSSVSLRIASWMGPRERQCDLLSCCEGNASKTKVVFCLCLGYQGPVTDNTPRSRSSPISGWHVWVL